MRSDAFIIDLTLFLLSMKYPMNLSEAEDTPKSEKDPSIFINAIPINIPQKTHRQKLLSHIGNFITERPSQISKCLFLSFSRS